MRSVFERLTQRQRPVKNQKKKPMPLISAMIFALLAGALFPLALSPYHCWPLAILSPAIFYFLLHERSGKQAFLIGHSYGIGLWSVGAFWLYTSIHVYGNISAPVGIAMIGFVGLAMGLFNGIQAALYRRFFGESPLTFAPLWILTEWVKTWILTGFPWLFAGYAFTTYQLDSSATRAEVFLFLVRHLIQLDNFAPLAGIFAVSFVVVFLASSLVEVIRGRFFWVFPSIALCAIAVGLGYVQWTTPKNSKPLSVSLIQGNIPQDLKWLVEYQQKTLDIYHSLSLSEWGRDLVIWPESAIPMFQTDAAEFIINTAQIARDYNTTWLTSVPYLDQDSNVLDKNGYPPFYNSIINLDAQTPGIYKKQRLVPFGEYVPMRGFLDVLPALHDTVLGESFTAGDKGQAPLIVKGHHLGAAICYEVAYPNLTRLNARGTDFMITVSNDAWFKGSDGPWQHLQMVQMRAKETGRWFIRGTNTGVTAFINDQGHIVEQAKADERFILRGDLPAMQGETPYMRFGDWPMLILSGLLLLIGFIAKTQTRRRR